MVGGGGVAYLVTWHSSCLSFSSLTSPLPSLPTPTPPEFTWWAGCPSFAGGFVLAAGEVEVAEFQTPIIFDQNCNFNRSTAYRHPKIVKIIICTFDIIEMYLQFLCSQLQLFNNAKGKVHSKQPKQAPDSFIAPPTGLLKSL